MQARVPGTVSNIAVPIEIKLKPGWTYHARRRRFESDAGKSCNPFADLPKGCRIVYKVPELLRQDPSRLSEPERDLIRYLQIILPPEASAADHVDKVRSWPCIQQADVGPIVSLP